MAKISNFASLEWTFIKRLHFNYNGKIVKVVVFGAGPYLYSILEDKGPARRETFAFDAQLCVFEATGTYVRGVENLNDAYVAVWGDAYLAHFPCKQLLEGGVVCQQNILSTGLRIAAVNALTFLVSQPKYKGFEVYYDNGMSHQLLSTFNKQGHPTADPFAQMRLPMRKLEKITTAIIKGSSVFMGSSHGRLMEMQFAGFKLIKETVICKNGPIRQIVTEKGQEHASMGKIFLLFENGSIVVWKNIKPIREFKGRYTCIANNLTNKKSNESILFTGDRYLLAGDMDGNLTIFRVSHDDVEPIRIIRSISLNRITVIELINSRDALICSNMGDYNWFDMTQISQPEPCSGCQLAMIECDHRCRIIDGLYSLKDDKLLKKPVTIKNQASNTEINVYFERKDQKKKYLYCTDKEIVFICNQYYYRATVRTVDGITSECNESMFNSCWQGPVLPIVQVILMPSFVLLEFVKKQKGPSQQLMYINPENSRLVSLCNMKTKGRLTAAACLEDYETTGKYPRTVHIIRAYLDGNVIMTAYHWNSDHSMERDGIFTYPIELFYKPGTFIVSMITSRKYVGNFRCIFLSNKGIAYLMAAHPITGQKERYTAILQQDLSRIIGRGHSLIETSLGILATGFKQSTLHVCWISLDEGKSAQYHHLFSVNTKSSRLPYTVNEGKIRVESTQSNNKELIASYYHESGIKEESFPFVKPTIIDSLKHSGIITTAGVLNNPKDESQFNILTGDTDGRFCLWFTDEKSKAGHKCRLDFKLNGAVTDIIKFDYHIVVATSQGDLNMYAIDSRSEYVGLIPSIVYNMGQKITHLTLVPSFHGNYNLLLVFLEDGTVEKVLVHKDNIRNNGNPAIKSKNIATFSNPTKMAIWLNQQIFHRTGNLLLSLGMDGYLRRTRLWTSGNVLVTMNWKISMIKRLHHQNHDIFLVGEPCGWFYLLWSNEAQLLYFNIDNYHSVKIIDADSCKTDDGELFIVSLDISGIVVLRRVELNANGAKKVYPPFIWACPVPSPKKIIVLNYRKIMVVGRGVATENF